MRLAKERLEEIRSHLCLPISVGCTKCELLGEIDVLESGFTEALGGYVRMVDLNKVLRSELDRLTERIKNLREVLEGGRDRWCGAFGVFQHACEHALAEDDKAAK